MMHNRDLTMRIAEMVDRDGMCWLNGITEYLWPFDQAYRAWIIEDIAGTDEFDIFWCLYSIEVKMVESSSIFLIVCIGWTPDDELWISEV
jgi:hypothetical protein